MSFSQSTLPSTPAPEPVFDAAEFQECVTKTGKLLHDLNARVTLTPYSVKVLSTMQTMLTMFSDLDLFKLSQKDHDDLIELADNKVLWKETLEKLKLPSKGIIVTDELEHALHYREEETKDYLSMSILDMDEVQTALLKSIPSHGSTEEYKLTPENQAKQANPISQLRVTAIIGSGADNKGTIKFVALTCYTNNPRAVEITTIPNIQALQKLYDEKYKYMNDESKRLCIKYGVKAISATDTLFNFFSQSKWAPAVAVAGIGVAAMCISKLSQ